METTPGWRLRTDEGPGSPYRHAAAASDDGPAYRTLTYEVDGRVARLTFNRPEQGNAITPDTPLELAHAVERADLDPRVHVIVLSGRGKGFCGGYDLAASAEHLMEGGMRGADDRTGTVLDPVVQMTNHDPRGTWDPMVDYAMMSRFTKGFASLLHADKPTVAKIHGFCVAGGTDIALHCDQIVIAADAKIGYPPTRVWGVPSAGLWAHRLGDQRAKRLLLTGDTLSGREAAEWGLAIEAPDPAELDERTEVLVQRIAAMPLNQLMMVKLALNSALLAQGVQNSRMISTVFDGISRHTREGYAFQQRAAEAGFRQAVRERDSAPYDDFGPSTNKG
ncbi:crotonase/enoyl-CoA hydratase family protein [Nocardioides jiangxiensis]|uniref:Crotonase/enoyl-CoA hydratase family protein n=1 Tax=Nocardioides jiangxiensis TaxID=3064524 RepID=A0ABT9AZU5_9ACTN|nr:crotonase/enoyl-CoA hydratase family protein [Nocardioides sp. WY-20]MDO7868121.1 crotonase/enoyl-CoA hydratase family protein [Nocardioides sp. WY-20]